MQDGKSNVNQGGYVMPKDIQTHRDSIEQVVCDHGMSESILAVATTGSFTEAAKYLRCSKSKVSKLVANAELLLDDKIFARTTRSVHVTEMGSALVTMLQARKDHLRKLLN